MTPQEAIETIKIAIAEVEWNYDMNYAVAFEMAIEALKKLKPKKPKIKRLISIHAKDGTFKTYLCPVCDEIVHKNRNEWVHPFFAAERYCCKCGQVLEWSEIK